MKKMLLWAVGLGAISGPTLASDEARDLVRDTCYAIQAMMLCEDLIMRGETPERVEAVVGGSFRKMNEPYNDACQDGYSSAYDMEHAGLCQDAWNRFGCYGTERAGLLQESPFGADDPVLCEFRIAMPEQDDERPSYGSQTSDTATVNDAVDALTEHYRTIYKGASCPTLEHPKKPQAFAYCHPSMTKDFGALFLVIQSGEQMTVYAVNQEATIQTSDVNSLASSHGIAVPLIPWSGPPIDIPAVMALFEQRY